MAYLDKKETDKLRKLKQAESVWLCGVREGKMNFGDAASLGIRPHYVLVLDATSQDIRLFDVAENAPDVTAMAQRLAKAMLSPGEALAGAGMGLAGLLQKPAKMRPARVLLDDAEFVRQLAPIFAELGVTLEHFAPLTPIDEMVGMLDQMLNQVVNSSQDNRVALLDTPGVTPALAGDLFEAAAQFHKAAIWEHVFNEDIVSVTYQTEGETSREYFFAIMGNGGMEFGVAAYDSLEDINAVLNMNNPDNPMAAIGTQRGFCLNFAKKEEMHPDDVKAMKKFKWPLVCKDAHPMVLKFSGDTGMISASSEEVAVLAAALRVLPDFVVNHMHADDDDPVDASHTYTLPAAHGGASVALSFPVEGLEILGDDMDLLDLENNPELVDQMRAMFGDLGIIGDGIEDEQPKLPPANVGAWKKRK